MATYVFPAVMSRGILSNQVITAGTASERIWSPLISHTGLTLDVVALDGTVTRSAGSFLDDGVLVGYTVTFTNFANAGNNASFVVAAVTDLVITVVDNTGMVDESGDGDETYSSPNPERQQPLEGSRGFILKAAAANAASIFIGSSSVTTANGLDVAASDVVAGAIDGAGASEIYQIVAGAGPEYLIMEIG